MPPKHPNTPQIQTYSHLPHLPRPQHALTLLRRLASLVSPLMTAHHFTIGTLSEFHPSDPHLLGLNVNRGQKICIRLRPASSPSQFLPEVELVGTMLHELTHNLHGPHDERFYGFLRKLEEEYYALRAGGWNGSGFYSNGRRLGGVGGVGAAEVRRQAVMAAEAREGRLQGSGRKLGGGGDGGGVGGERVRREMLAMAAERRRSDQRTCAGANEGLAQESIRRGFATAAAEEDVNDAAAVRAAIELIDVQEGGTGWREESGVVWIDDDDGDASLPATKKRPSPTLSISGGGGGGGGGEQWVCMACTLINPPTFLYCEACGAQFAPPPPSSRSPVKKTPFLSPASQAILAAPEKKPQPEKKWRCHLCSLHNAEMWWTCQSCGVMKLQS